MAGAEYPLTLNRHGEAFAAATKKETA